MFHLRTFLSILLCVFTSLISFSQQTWPNTLLWRISGHGLSKPSYLYGTLHLQDKRLFNFGDSLYQSIEAVDGFALEIDFKEYMDSVFTKGIQRAEEKFLAEQKVKIDKKKLDESTDSLFKKLGIDKDHVSKKDLKKIRDYRINKYQQLGEMQTIVDGYLFGLALRQGKWTGAVEDVADQLNLSDELGAELTPERVLESDAAMRKGLEQMIQIYLRQDLQMLNQSINGYNPEYKDAVLTRRNIKMARRMDSLCAIRTMFFAIGAAHLAGDSGVVSLLRSRGFTVEPVYSSKKIAAETYAKKLEDIPWYKVEDDNKLYTVEMPGNPSQFNEFGEMMKMKMFFDITTMTFYMSSQTIGKVSSTKEFEDLFKSMAVRMGASTKNIKPKAVSRNGLQAMEESFDIDQASYIVQVLHKDNSIFMLMAGSNKKSNLATPDIDRFFTSFITHDVKAPENEWVKFSLPDKAFSVKLPGQPKKNATIDRQSSGSNWNFLSYDFVDNAKGIYYVMQVRDLKEGFYLDGDSVYFERVAEETKARMDSILKKELSTYKGFPALYIDALYNKNIIYKTMYVTRGNRVYSLMVGTQSNTTLPEATTFFNSLEFEAYPVSEWKQYASEGFYTTAPAVITRLAADTTEDGEHSKSNMFVSSNIHEAISYEVIKQPFPKYYWTDSDSSYFETKADAYIKEGDSLLNKKITMNGQLKSLDLLVQKPHQNNLQKVRILVSGDTLYTLIAFIPKQYIDKKYHRDFFEDFRINKEVPPTIYANKAAALLQALKTKDSLQFSQALESFQAVKFAKEDLPVLHMALLENYSDSGNDYSIYEKIMNAVVDLADSSTVDFVASNYEHLPAEKENIKYSLLELLANIHSSKAYDQIKHLLLTKLPSKGSASALAYALTDTLKLTKTLYPEILQLSKDTAFAEALVVISDPLLDSSLISMEDILPFKNVFLQQARRKYQVLKANQSQWWQYNSLISLLGKFNDKESNALLQQYLGLPIPNVKYNTIIPLIKNGQQVSPTEMKNLAADKNFRASLYYKLKEINKQQLFPTAYATQQSLAESELYQIASDDYEVSATTFIGERVILYQGKKKKFYLYKVTLNVEEGERESYLAIAGPYDLKAKALIPYADASGFYWDEPYNKQKVEQQLKSYITSMEAAEE
jgi:uncharacterized protein YbaP (TraB family)/HEAT repeat protein